MGIRRSLAPLILVLLAASCASNAKSTSGAVDAPDQTETSATPDSEPSSIPVSSSFLIPGGDEIIGFYELYKALAPLEGAAEPDTAIVDLAIGLVDGKPDLQTYLAEAYFRMTTNPAIKARARPYLASRGSEAKEARRILQYFDRTKTGGQNPQDTRVALPDGMSAEEINLFSLGEVNLFDGGLSVTTFVNEWTVLSFEGHENSLHWNYGGGTNCITMDFDKYPVPEDTFLRAVNDSVKRQPYKNWIRWDLSGDSSLAGSNADIILLFRGSRIDEFTIKWGVSALYLYSRAAQCGYSTTWTMNFSYINTFYEDPVRLLDYLSTVMLLTWINPPQKRI